YTMNMRIRKTVITCLLCTFTASLFAQEIPLLGNIYDRQYQSLNGKWNYVIDPLENGYYDYRLMPFEKAGFFENKKATSPDDLVEYNLDTSTIMDISSD
ncbi:MAG: beta-glucuronidase, partial [Bacteroides sp.]|nr:beta-glucuronidase [Bacteroides sp.]